MEPRAALLDRGRDLLGPDRFRAVLVTICTVFRSFQRHQALPKPRDTSFLRRFCWFIPDKPRWIDTVRVGESSQSVQGYVDDLSLNALEVLQRVTDPLCRLFLREAEPLPVEAEIVCDAMPKIPMQQGRRSSRIAALLPGHPRPRSDTPMRS